MIEVIEPGPLTSVQTAIGRLGWRHLGVPVGGAADAWSARLANRLVSNEDDAALLEMTSSGATLRFTSSAIVAVAGGAWDATVDGLDLAPFAARAIRAGATLRLGTGAGLRAYVAVGGGLGVEPTLGSASTDLRSGFGGPEGRALRTGDRLDHAEGRGPMWRWTGTRPDGPIRIVDGPHGGATELEGAWRLGVEADRMGVRLDGRSVSRERSEVPSMGLPLGAIQVPPDGRPIVMLADRPVTGGYRVPACVIGADVGRVAQLRPGDEVRLRAVSVDEARAAWTLAEEELASLEAVELGDGDGAGWAGSHA